jgi:hypothetical protein
MFTLISQSTPIVDQIPSLGAAGLMGAMWLWERRTNQKREQQIDESHERIMSDKVQLDQLIDLVKQSTEVLTRLSATQEQLLRELGAARP